VATSASHGAGSRQPVSYRGRRIAGLYQRATADGRLRFDWQTKTAGRTRRVVLGASTVYDALREVDRLKAITSEAGLPSGAVRLGGLVDRYLRESRAGTYTPPRGPLSPSTLELHEGLLRRHVVPGLGASTRIRDLRAPAVRTLIGRLSGGGLSGSTVASCIAALNGAMRYAVRVDLLGRNPLVDLDGDLPSRARLSEPVYLSREQAEDLLGALGPEFRPLCATLLYAGARVSEALGLTWGDLDLGAGTVDIHRQLARNGRDHAPLKTASSRAVLTLPAPLIEELRQHRDRVLRRRGFQAVAGDELVFATPTGRSPGRRNSLRAVQAAAGKIGLRGAEGQPVGLHDLRHSCASLLRAAGLSDEEIAPYLRHASPRTTAMLYGGRDSDDLRAVRRRGAAALS
jgi:integrase